MVVVCIVYAVIIVYVGSTRVRDVVDVAVVVVGCCVHAAGG